MRISIVTIGTRMPAWVSQGVAEYSKRMPRELRVEWKELPLAARGKGSNAGQLKEREGEQILKAIPATDRVIALDVGGKPVSTEGLAGQLSDWQMSGDNYSLLIGGPDGLSAACLARAERSWSLSALTLPHPLVRILLAEQLYRAWTITVNHPYHRE
ncbi:23S rRNA (pseudouridine(1915)-N(3))-methyltransferase RlmH [Seongchinamella sediminis]|uniref:Ribosomal RNA large subunit methyltransferase H n=1 Tax=Seongchinamella sediminis TaxID=2283635 RepID=A0A3L7DVB7_9GAMM|nr:23S rRNA (pseudouridine(1915)-N(3))-methyltransferase RlmH [Seongchinamella sediminis]RLQ21244.1 23S rRNA (pseudouridine(1915)-N(3))-methyltransferase RlmH [Seongchinamella sediminis]